MDEQSLRETYNAPPEGIGKVAKLFRVCLFLGQVHEERWEDESQEANVHGREQFLYLKENKYKLLVFV